jgi:4-oxalomesaconate tautomerase
VSATTPPGPDDSVRCMLMRGGTSKGAYFRSEDLPAADAARDDLLLRLLGSPDPRQVDGLGGGHPLTSKVAVVSRSGTADADLDYLFLQVVVDQPVVTAGQPCGNILAGVGPFGLERGLLPAGPDGPRTVRIRMVNTGGLAEVTFGTAAGRPRYTGDHAISGVPFPAAPVAITFADTEGAVCGSLLPTGQVRDVLNGTPVTCIDNGMPVVLVAARDLGVTGRESCRELEGNTALRARVELLRLAAGHAMGLGDVTDRTVPKMTVLAPPRDGGDLTTRSFIPHRCHASIGVLAAVSVATAACLPGSVAAEVADEVAGGTGPGGERRRIRLEHPTGYFDTDVEQDDGRVVRTSILSSARKLFDGLAWPRTVT